MTVPSFNDLYTSIKNDLRNRLDITSLVGKVVLLAFAAVQAAKQKIQYLALYNVYQNVFVDTADYDMLRRYGEIKLGRLPYAAVAGEYAVEVTGDVGATIAPGTTYKSLDTSTSPDKMYILDTLFTFTATTGSIQIRALEGGTDSALEVGDELQLTAPVANVDSFAEVTSEVTAAVDEEDIEEYRINVIEAFRLEPQGGAKVDYMLWAQDAEGVRRVYPYVPSSDPGNIDLYVEAFPDDSVPAGTGVPPGAILSDVEDVVNQNPDTSLPDYQRGRRPMGVFEIDYKAVTPLDVDIEITSATGLTNSSDIEAAVVSFLYEIRPYIDGADVAADRNDKLYKSDIYGIVKDLLQSGETFTSIDVTVSSVSIDIYTFEDGDIPYLNSLTVV